MSFFSRMESLELLQRKVKKSSILSSYDDACGCLIDGSPQILLPLIRLSKEWHLDKFDGGLVCFETEPIHSVNCQFSSTDPIIMFNLRRKAKFSTTQEITSNMTALKRVFAFLSFYQFIKFVLHRHIFKQYVKVEDKSSEFFNFIFNNQSLQTFFAMMNDTSKA